MLERGEQRRGARERRGCSRLGEGVAGEKGGARGRGDAEERAFCTAGERARRESSPFFLLVPSLPSHLYLFVKHEPSASITGSDVKFSDAISSTPRLRVRESVILLWGK